MDLLIGGLKEASTIDYPGELVSVLFLCQCPFRCPFCQNWGLVKGEDCNKASIETILAQLRQNKRYITGLCVTGGEPTVQIEGLIELLKVTHEMGLLNKLDTNGFYPERLESLLNLKLVDYIALDVKMRLDPESYGLGIGNPALGKLAVSALRRTLALLKDGNITYETRTTVVPTLNDTLEQIEAIASQLQELEVPRYILQQFRASGGTLEERFGNLAATDRELLLQLGRVAKQFIQDVRIRTIEAGEERIEL